MPMGSWSSSFAIHGASPHASDDPAQEPPLSETPVGGLLFGQPSGFNIPLHVEGTDFQQRVWKKFLKIPYGQAISYLELARRLGDEKCIRAAARANGANPIAILIPCHRVIGSDGSLVGYGGGLDMKEFLLRLEGVLPKAPPQPRLPLTWD